MIPTTSKGEPSGLGIWARLEGSGQRILVVDDSGDSRALLTGLLDAHGYSVREAADGCEALELAREADLLLLDLRMPGLDGLGVCRHLRAQDATRFLPVMVVTALSNREDRIAAMEAGADDFLTKPIDGVELLVRTRSMLRVRELRDANDRLRSDFTSMLVHDLRAPLTAISGFLELIEEGREGKERADHVRRALESVGRMRRIVDEMLDVAVLEAGRITLDLETVDLRGLLEEVLAGLEPLTRARHLRAEVTIAPDLGPVCADAYRLGRALINLVDNAVKFADRRVRVVAARDGDVAVVHIEDDGPGVKSEEVPLLFRRFTQSASGRSLGKGSGLGLAIAQLLVEAHGGRIWAEPQERGMAFVLVLPAVSACQPE